MSKILREVRSGRLGYAVLYTQSSLADGPRARAEKSRATTEARQKINLRRSWQQLELTLHGNFGRDDFHLTLTYDAAHLPDSREIAAKRVKKFLSKLRAVRKKRGEPLRYVYVTENRHGDGRVHHHLVLNGTGHDLDEFRSLWPDGHVHIQNLRPRDFGCLARYLTKEAREHGKRLGAKSWVSSQNLAKPYKPKAVAVPDLMTLTAPPDADPLESSGGEVRLGEFGTYAYIKYILRSPEDFRPPREPSGDPEEDLSLWALQKRKPHSAKI